jgi:hypothetical protein
MARHLWPLGSLIVLVAALSAVGSGANVSLVSGLEQTGSPRAPQAAGADRTPAIERVDSPAGAADAAEPQMTHARGRTILSWLELAGRRSTLKFAERTATGWSEPRTVASGDDFMVNSADVPSVVVLADGTLAAHWFQENGPDPEAYNLLLSWSKDEGRTWSAPVNPHHDGVETQHGFASLFQAPRAGLGLVWLDGRAITPDAPEGSGNMGLRAAIFERDGKQRNDSAVDTRVCECCPTAAAATSEGVIVAYRNRSANEIRDIYVTRLANGRWSTPDAVHNDGWRITGCPVNGPAISARGRDVVVAWFTAKDGPGRAFVAFSRDAGRSFSAPVRVDDASSLGRVDVELLADGSAAVTWIEFANERSEFRVRVVDRPGARGPAAKIADSGGTRYPRLTRFGNELLFAWTETDNDSPRVRTARALLPADLSAGAK